VCVVGCGAVGGLFAGHLGRLDDVEVWAYDVAADHVAAINERDAGSHFELGSVFDRTQRYPQAAREFERAAELSPTDPAPHYRLSRIYDRLGKREAAQHEREQHAKLLAAQDNLK